MPFRLFATTALILLLASCGGGGSDSGSSSSSSSSSSGGGSTSSDRVALTATAPTAPVPSSAGAELVFQVANPSTTAATNVVLNVNLGAGLSHAGIRCVALSGAICPVDNSTLTVPTLAGGGTLRFTVSVMVGAGVSGPIASNATVSAANDGETQNNTVTMTVTAYAADVSITGSTTASDFTSGSLVPYSFTVSNAGPDAARNLAFEAALSSGQVNTGITCSASGGATCPAVTAANMTVPLLPSGGSLVFTLNSQLSINVLVAVNATLRVTTQGDSNLANNLTTVSAITRIPTSPDSPSFFQVQSDPGDWVGMGGNYAYTKANAVFDLSAIGRVLRLELHGDENWSVQFHMPVNETQLRTGTYTDLIGAPFHDPNTGGLRVTGMGNGCSSQQGWFKVDGAEYAAGELASVDIRFEQRCGGGAIGLRGQLHWVRGDETRPPGPVNPAPGGLWEPPAGSTPTTGNYVYLASDPGDFLGRGVTETFTQANATFFPSRNLRVLEFGIGGRTGVLVSFIPMSPLTELETGYYPETQRAWSGNPAVGGLSVNYESRGCNVSTGWFVIDHIVFDGEAVAALDARFEHHCEGNTPAIRGKIHWRPDDATQPPGPVVPPPDGLWAPPAGAVPATGNVVYLQSDAGEFVGQGRTMTYTPLTSVIGYGGGYIAPAPNRFTITVTGDEEWVGHFQAMSSISEMRAGYYGNLVRFPSGAVEGSLSWTGEGRACNQVSGWFVVDEVTYSGSTLTSIALRFAHHCEMGSRALRGYVRWSASDTRTPPPPQNPPPAGLWEPAGGATPASGNYVYLQSEAGDFVGDGKTYLYTPTDAQFTLMTLGSQVDVEVQGDTHWKGHFRPMVPLAQLVEGYYDLSGGENIAKGGFWWGGDGRGCPGSGWFVVDEVTFEGSALRSLTVRFERACEGFTGVLRGKIHWRYDDSTAPVGPIYPAPAGIWTPPPGAVPATGNFFYVTGDPGEFITGGGTYLYTPANVLFQGGSEVDFSGGFVSAQNSASDVSWAVHLFKMVSIPRLQPGYYPDVVRNGPTNPARGGISVSGRGSGCGSTRGWFVIDSVTYNGENMTSLDARFEQFCGDSNIGLRGSVRWSQ